MLSHGDGWITAGPDESMMARFRAEGRGPACASVKVCWIEDQRTAQRLARKLWPHTMLPSTINQDLSRPDLFEAASTLVDDEHVAQTFLRARP